MRYLQFTISALAAFGFTVVTQLPAQALDPAAKCESGKLKEAGKYASCHLKAESVAVKKGTTADYSKCTSKFSAKWDKLESKGAGLCPSNGDEASMDTRITTDADEIATLLAGGSVPECGNGVVESGEDCDFQTLNGQDCISQGFAAGTLSCAAGCVFDTSACVSAKLVFGSAGTWTGNLGGLAGADAICQSEAQAAGLSGTFKAWLSTTDGTSPATRFTHSSVPYELPNGIQVAASWADLTDGIIAHAIDLDATGGPAHGGAWTYTAPDGSIPSTYNSCLDWLSSSPKAYGVFGDGGWMTQGWTDSPGSPAPCDLHLGLFCFEQ